MSGQGFAGYRIEGIAGQGGMSIVYLALQVSLDRPVALKMIAPELAAHRGFRASFRVSGTTSLLGVARDQLLVTGDPAKDVILRRLDKRTGRQLGPTVQEVYSSGTGFVLANGINVVHWIAAAVLTFDNQLGSMKFIDFRIPGSNSILGPQGTEMAVGRGDVAWVLVNYSTRAGSRSCARTCAPRSRSAR